MGVDAQCFIPAATPPDDILDAMAIICGSGVSMEMVGGGTEAFEAYRIPKGSYKVQNGEHFWGQVVMTTHDAQANSFNPNMWYPQYREGEFYWTLNERSYAYPIAVFKLLVDHFGGKVIAMDSDGEVTYESEGRVKRKKTGETPDDGKAYHKYQLSFKDLRKPTYHELAEADDESAYKQGEHGWS